MRLKITVVKIEEFSMKKSWILAGSLLMLLGGTTYADESLSNQSTASQSVTTEENKSEFITVAFLSNNTWQEEKSNTISLVNHQAVKISLNDSKSSLTYKIKYQDKEWTEDYKNNQEVEIQPERIDSLVFSLESEGDNLSYRVSADGINWSTWYDNGQEADLEGISYLQLKTTDKISSLPNTDLVSSENSSTVVSSSHIEYSVSSTYATSSSKEAETSSQAVDSNSTMASEETSSSVSSEVTSSQNESSKMSTFAAVPTNAMYRMYNPNSGEHFYTANSNEASSLINAGWRYEGIGWNAPQWGVPVYRLYNKNAGDHHYTTSSGEKDSLVSAGWKYEGIGWYSSDGKQIAILRAYNPNARAGSHNFTASRAEQNSLVSHGWRDEGISWYASNISPDVNRDKDLRNQYEIKHAVDLRMAKKPYYYSQLDGRWSGIYVGNYPFGPSGCVSTSLAMILRGCYGQNITPIEVGRTMASIGYFNQSYYGASATDLVKTARYYGRSISSVKTKSEMDNALAQGFPVILLQNVGIGHAVVAHGYKNGYTEVYDPYGKKFYSGKVSTSELWSTPSNDSIDWQEGTPRFVVR